MGRPKTTITPGQCRAARALVGLSQRQLVEAAKLSRTTLTDFERERKTPEGNALAAIQHALESSGVTFISGGRQA
jgi:transcriptional regulator with XRE-family HTH domain